MKNPIIKFLFLNRKTIYLLIILLPLLWILLQRLNALSKFFTNENQAKQSSYLSDSLIKEFEKVIKDSANESGHKIDRVNIVETLEIVKDHHVIYGNISLDALDGAFFWALEDKYYVCSNSSENILSYSYFEKMNIHEKIEYVRQIFKNLKAHEFPNEEIVELYGDKIKEVRNLKEKCELLIKKGENEKALTIAEKILAINKEIYNSENLQVSQNLTDIGNLYLGIPTPNPLKAVSLYERALIIRENALGLWHPAVADSLMSLSMANGLLGNFAVAEALSERALTIKKNAYGPLHPDIATCMSNLASIYQFMGYFAKAKPLFEGALGINLKNFGSENLKTASSLENYAMICGIQGNLDNVEPTFIIARSIKERILGPEHPEVISSMKKLAEYYHFIGDYNKAESLYKKIITINENVPGSENLEVAESMSDLAKFYVLLSDYSKAESLYIKSLTIKKKTLGSEHISVVSDLSGLAEIYLNLDNYNKAKELYIEILDIKKRIYGSEHFSVASDIDGMAEVYFHLGNKTKAKSLYEKALAIRRKTFGPSHPTVADSLINLATVGISLGEYIKAESQCEEALAIKKETYGLEHPLVAESMLNLAFLYAVLGKYENSQTLTKSSITIDTKLINQVDYFTSEKQKINFISRLDFSLYFFLSLINQFDQSQSAKEIGFNSWLSRKGRILETNKQFQKILLNSDDKEISQVAINLSNVRGRLSKLIFSDIEKVETDSYKNELPKLKEQKEELEAVLSRLSKPFLYEQKKSNANCISLAAAMPSNTVLVDFARISLYNFKVKNKNPNWLPERYIAFIIHSGNGNKIDWVDLGPADEIDKTISSFRKALAGVNTDLSKNTTNILNKLHALLFLPIRSKLGNTKEIFISPDGDLNLLPFEALQDKDGKFLIEDYIFNYLSAGRDILGFGEAIEGNNKSLIIGNPDFNMNDEQKISSINNLGFKIPDKKGMVKRSKDVQNNGAWQSLPGTLDEVQAIYNLIGKDNAELFTGEKAIEETLMYWGVPKVLHLATHGFFLENKPIDFKNNKITRGFSLQSNNKFVSPSPVSVNTENSLLRSGIVLAGANKLQKIDDNTISDGIVTSEEILGMNLQGTEMVVLSACDTGLGEVKNGEGVFGLRRAFTQAGAKSLVMSMWKVPDKETKELMVNFYSNIYKKGLNRCQALRQATLEQLQTTKQRYGNSNPYYWGAFVFMGEP